MFEGGFGVIRGEVWVNALQGTLACCIACASATVYHIYPRPPRAGLPEALLVAIVAAMDMVRGRGLALALRVFGLALAFAAALALALAHASPPENSNRARAARVSAGMLRAPCAARGGRPGLAPASPRDDVTGRVARTGPCCCGITPTPVATVRRGGGAAAGGAGSAGRGVPPSVSPAAAAPPRR